MPRKRILPRAALTALLVVLAAGSSGGACARDWDAYDPRLGAGAGVTTSGSGGQGGLGQGGLGQGGQGQGGGGGSLPSGEHLCSKSFGDGLRQSVRDIAADSRGNVVITGFFEGSFNFGGGQLTSAGAHDIFVAKFDAQCNHVFSIGIGGQLNDSGWGVAVDGAGDIVVTGSFQGTVSFGNTPLTSAGLDDVFVVKLNSAGNFLWSNSFGDVENQWGTRIAFDPSGNIVLSGDFNGAVDFGGGALASLGSDVFVVKLTPQGNHVFSKRFGGPDWDHGRALAVDAIGNVFIAGGFSQSMDVGGVTMTSPGLKDMFTIKLGPTGIILWGRQFGSPGMTDDDYARGIAVDASGNVFVAGRFEGSIDLGQGPVTSAGLRDIFLVKLSSAGAPLWGERLGGALDDNVRDVTIDALGNIFLTGHFQGEVDFGGGVLTSAGGGDVFVAKYDPAGNHLWSKSFGDAADQSGTATALIAAGPVALVGDVHGGIDLGGGLFTSAGGRDIFIAMFSR